MMKISGFVSLSTKLDEREECANMKLNEGFSGGENVNSSTLDVTEPTFALLDEGDSGLDIDALKVVSKGVNTMREALVWYHTLPTSFWELHHLMVHVMMEGHYYFWWSKLAARWNVKDTQN